MFPACTPCPALFHGNFLSEAILKELIPSICDLMCIFITTKPLKIICKTKCLDLRCSNILGPHIWIGSHHCHRYRITFRYTGTTFYGSETLCWIRWPFLSPLNLNPLITDYFRTPYLTTIFCLGDGPNYYNIFPGPTQSPMHVHLCGELSHKCAE